MVIPNIPRRVLRATSLAATPGALYTAHQVPEDATDKVQRDWNARQWREVEHALVTISQQLDALAARVDAIETAPASPDTWDNALVVAEGGRDAA